MQHVWARGEVSTGFWWGDLRERDHLEDPRVDNIKMDLQEVGWEHGLDWYGSGEEQVAGSCKQLRKYEILKKRHVP
jgi:hypothetical protein